MSLPAADCASVLAGEVPAASVQTLCERLASAVEEETAFATFRHTSDWVNLGVSLLCMLTAAMAAGLTMGVVSLDELELRIKQRGEVLSEVLHANRLLPLIRIKPHHQLLVTLLLLNSVANEALPLFLDKLVPQWAAILISVSAVLFVGEIIPAAIFTGPAKMRIAAALTPVVWTAVLLMYPLAYPIGWALDKIIPERSALTSRAEVRALVDVQREIAAERGAEDGEAFNEDEADLVRGALSLSTKMVVDVMVPLGAVHALPAQARMDHAMMRDVISRGHSRVPVYWGPHPSSITSFLHVKDHIMLNPADDSLFALLNTFQQGHAHMAFVSRQPDLARLALPARGEWPKGKSACIGVITLEDIIEEILTEEIYDESDLVAAASTITNYVKRFVRPRLDAKLRRVAKAAATSASLRNSGCSSVANPFRSVEPLCSTSSSDRPRVLSRQNTTTAKQKVLRGNPLRMSVPPPAQQPAVPSATCTHETPLLSEPAQQP